MTSKNCSLWPWDDTTLAKPLWSTSPFTHRLAQGTTDRAHRELSPAAGDIEQEWSF